MKTCEFIYQKTTRRNAAGTRCDVPAAAAIVMGKSKYYVCPMHEGMAAEYLRAITPLVPVKIVALPGAGVGEGVEPSCQPRNPGQDEDVDLDVPFGVRG